MPPQQISWQKWDGIARTKSPITKKHFEIFMAKINSQYPYPSYELIEDPDDQYSLKLKQLPNVPRQIKPYNQPCAVQDIQDWFSMWHDDKPNMEIVNPYHWIISFKTIITLECFFEMFKICKGEESYRVSEPDVKEGFWTYHFWARDDAPKMFGSEEPVASVDIRFWAKLFDQPKPELIFY